jgi:hypothetical protein
MSNAVAAAEPSLAELMRGLEGVLVERQKIIECGDALAATGRCCTASHTPRQLARELAALLRQQKLLLHRLAALLPPAHPPL